MHATALFARGSHQRISFVFWHLKVEPVRQNVHGRSGNSSLPLQSSGVYFDASRATQIAVCRVLTAITWLASNGRPGSANMAGQKTCCVKAWSHDNRDEIRREANWLRLKKLWSSHNCTSCYLDPLMNEATIAVYSISVSESLVTRRQSYSTLTLSVLLGWSRLKLPIVVDKFGTEFCRKCTDKFRYHFGPEKIVTRIFKDKY